MKGIMGTCPFPKLQPTRPFHIFGGSYGDGFVDLIQSLFQVAPESRMSACNENFFDIFKKLVGTGTSEYEPAANIFDSSNFRISTPTASSTGSKIMAQVLERSPAESVWCMKVTCLGYLLSMSAIPT